MKSYTNIEQSKKLAEFLAIESADMFHFIHEVDTVGFGYKKDAAESYSKTEFEYIPCWSLAALLNVLPNFIGDYGKCLYYDVGGYYCGYMNDGDFMLTIKETNADNPVDACYEMVLKLKELNLL